ncbi:MAG TPA: hypothetical protein VMG35_12125 [Bryobacteraceae bacterium]|nr:hypothetical protein [Bryobacteraceae bacterium]
MSWFAYVIAALNADVLREIAFADEYLRLARLLKRSSDPMMTHQIAVCAATALSNATALAAEMIALGAAPLPVAPAPRTHPATPKSSEQRLTEARSALAHYQRRLAMARQFGLQRLQEVFREIVSGKRKHLAHTQAAAAAAAKEAENRMNWERFDANCGSDE